MQGMTDKLFFILADNNMQSADLIKYQYTFFHISRYWSDTDKLQFFGNKEPIIFLNLKKKND